MVWVLPAFSFVVLSGLCLLPEELRRKQDQANHEHGYTENAGIQAKYEYSSILRYSRYDSEEDA